MKKKFFNEEHIEGRLYDHTLAIKTVQNTESKNYGKEFIGGKIDIATDDEGLNIVTVEYTYVTETTSTGKKDARFTVLKNIIENGKTIAQDGMDVATMIKCDKVTLGVNDFYNKDDELVSAKRNEGSWFISTVTKLSAPDKRNLFDVDILINETQLVEADEERGIAEDYLIVRGGIFNDYTKAMAPVELVVKNSGGISYFESLGANKKEPVFTRVWGKIECQTIITRKEKAAAFGEPAVTEYEKKIREWVITGAASDTYEIGDAENGITVEEINKAIADRNTYLAEVKKRQDEYNASKTAGTIRSENAKVTAAAGGFNF